MEQGRRSQRFAADRRRCGLVDDCCFVLFWCDSAAAFDVLDDCSCFVDSAFGQEESGRFGQAASPPQQEDHWKRGDDGGDSPADFWVGRDDDWCDDSGEYIAEGEEADCPGDEFAADAGRRNSEI